MWEYGYERLPVLEDLEMGEHASLLVLCWRSLGRASTQASNRLRVLDRDGKNMFASRYSVDILGTAPTQCESDVALAVYAGTRDRLSSLILGDFPFVIRICVWASGSSNRFDRDVPES